MMTGGYPKQVIVDFLSNPQESGVRVDVVTIHFIKERIIPGHQLYAIMFEDDAGQQYYGNCLLRQDTAGNWRIGGASWGAGIPVRSQPWANLGGGDGSNFYAGGYVSDNGFNVARVRLIGDNGVVLEDTVENGQVLFLTDQHVETPVKIELYDDAGKSVGSHIALPEASFFRFQRTGRTV